MDLSPLARKLLYQGVKGEGNQLDAV